MSAVKSASKCNSVTHILVAKVIHQCSNMMYFNATLLTLEVNITFSYNCGLLDYILHVYVSDKRFILDLIIDMDESMLVPKVDTDHFLHFSSSYENYLWYV